MKDLNMKTILGGHLRTCMFNSGENILKIATKRYKENIDIVYVKLKNYCTESISTERISRKYGEENLHVDDRQNINIHNIQRFLILDIC